MKLGWMTVLGLSVALGCTAQQAAVKTDEPVATQAPAAAEPAKEAHAGMQPPLDDATGAKKAFDAKPQPGEKALCAVSDEPFLVTAETKTAEYEGKWYAFCCDDCVPEFEADPAKYAN